MRTIRPADGPPADAPTKPRMEAKSGLYAFEATYDRFLGRVTIGTGIDGGEMTYVMLSKVDTDRLAGLLQRWEPVVEPVAPPEPEDEPLFKAIARVRGYVHETPGSADLDRIVDALHAPSVLVDSQGREWVPTLPADLRPGDVIPWELHEGGVAEVLGVRPVVGGTEVSVEGARRFYASAVPVCVLRGER